MFKYVSPDNTSAARVLRSQVLYEFQVLGLREVAERILEGYLDGPLPDGRKVYHGSLHVLCVTAVSLLLADEYKLGIHDRKTLMFAALAHDHGHTLGAHPDSANVTTAKSRIEAMLKERYSLATKLALEANNLDVTRIQEAIGCTVYEDGGFPVEPTTLVQRILRDADLMMFTCPVYPELMMRLDSELGLPETTDWTHHVNFLANATFYTERGRQLRDEFVRQQRG